MMWENNVKYIVMLTGLIEGGKNKCERYWPAHADGQFMQFGPVKVFTTDIKACKGYMRSEFRVEVAGSESRKLVHFWFNSWPDHGVPTDKDKKVYPDNLVGE